MRNWKIKVYSIICFSCCDCKYDPKKLPNDTWKINSKPLVVCWIKLENQALFCINQNFINYYSCSINWDKLTFRYCFCPNWHQFCFPPRIALCRVLISCSATLKYIFVNYSLYVRIFKQWKKSLSALNNQSAKLLIFPFFSKIKKYQHFLIFLLRWT